MSARTWPRQALAAREAELRAVQEADVVFCVSGEEAGLRRGDRSRQAHLRAHVRGRAARGAARLRRALDLVFFGGFLAASASPNEDSLAFLLNEVLPLVWEEHPEIGLTVIGADVETSAGARDSPRADRRLRRGPARLALPGEAARQPDALRLGGQAQVPRLARRRPAVRDDPRRRRGDPAGRGAASTVADDAAGLAQPVTRLYCDRAEWERVQSHLLESRARSSTARASSAR